MRHHSQTPNITRIQRFPISWISTSTHQGDLKSQEPPAGDNYYCLRNYFVVLLSGQLSWVPACGLFHIWPPIMAQYGWLTYICMRMLGMRSHILSRSRSPLFSNINPTETDVELPGGREIVRDLHGRGLPATVFIGSWSEVLPHIQTGGNRAAASLYQQI